MKDTMPPPSSDTLWDWAAYVLVAGWVAVIEALRRAHGARKAMAARIETQGREIESHLVDCKKYREAVADMERRQDDRHRENTTRLERIEGLLMARARGH